MDIILILKVISGTFMLMGIFGWVVYLIRTNALQARFDQIYRKLDTMYVDRVRNARLRYSQKEGFFSKLVGRPRQVFIYSGIHRRIKWLSFEVWVTIFMVGLIMSYGFVAIVFRVQSYAVITALVWAVSMFAYLQHRANKNYKYVGDNLISFLNDLGNFSAVGSLDVVSVFHNVAPYMNCFTLRDVLEECYNDAQMTGDPDGAMLALIDKVEHPKFKEIIMSLRLCMNYTSDYSIVIQSLRSNLVDEMRSAQEQKSIANSATVNMAMVSGMLVFMLYSTNSLLTEHSTFSMLFGTIPGMGVLLVILLAYLIFIITVMKARR